MTFSASIHRAMQDAPRRVDRTIDHHWRAFLQQMRDKLGVDTIALDEPYLPYVRAKFTLLYLARLEKLAGEPAFKLLDIGTIHPLPEGGSGGSGIGGVFDSIGTAISSTFDSIGTALSQSLDSLRQQAFGIQQYVWVGGECPECSALDGQTFNWGEGEEPGEVHPNCNCSAEPVVEGAGDGKEWEGPSGDDIANAALILAGLLLLPEELPGAIALGALARLGRIDRSIIGAARTLRGGKPEEKPTILSNNSNSEYAKRITDGHAYDKHIVKNNEFPEIKSREDFRKFAEDIMNNPSATKNLDRGRTAYWDSKTETIIIKDPANPDGGTIFRPASGKAYFDSL